MYKQHRIVDRGPYTCLFQLLPSFNVVRCVVNAVARLFSFYLYSVSCVLFTLLSLRRTEYERSISLGRIEFGCGRTVAYSIVCTFVWPKPHCRVNAAHTSACGAMLHRLRFGCFVSCRRCDRSSVLYEISKQVNVCPHISHSFVYVTRATTIVFTSRSIENKIH